MAVIETGLARRAARRRRGGWSLVEAVLSAAVLSTMLVVAAALLVLATRGADRDKRDDIASRQRDLERAAALVADDIASARVVLAWSSTGILLAVADPNGVDVREIEYRRTSADEGTMERIVDGGPAIALVAGVASLHFDAAAAEREGAVTIERDPEAAPLAASGPPATGSHAVASLSGAALTVRPALPENAVGWEVTALRIRAQQGAAASRSVTVELRTPVGLLPGGTVLATRVVRGDEVPASMGWFTVDLPDTVVPAGLDAVSVTFTTTSLLAPIAIETASNSPARSWDASHSGTLGAWLPMLGSGLTYELIGRVRVPTSTIERRLVAARVRIEPADAQLAAVERIVVPVAPIASEAALP